MERVNAFYLGISRERYVRFELESYPMKFIGDWPIQIAAFIRTRINILKNDKIF